MLADSKVNGCLRGSRNVAGDFGWEAGEEIPKGLWNEMFGDFRARTVHVRIIQTDDRKGIAEILVKKIGDRPGKK